MNKPNYPTNWTEDEIRAHERFCADQAEAEAGYAEWAAKQERPNPGIRIPSDLEF